MSLSFIRFIAGALLLVASVESAVAQQACADLMDLELPYTTITSAATAAEGAIPQPAIFGNTEPVIAPERCEVQAITRPTKDSEIRIELWLPLSGWNGKYLQIGNGGWAGSINRTGLIGPLQRGYAVAATDNGHVSEGLVPGATWAIGHPEKLIDFGHRAVHETSVQAKAILRAYFGRGQDLSYFSGCSDGGREALMEAQRYPEDFEGIIAGAPANNWSRLFTGFVWNERALAENPIPPAKLTAIQTAALAACDALDGVKDGLIENPRACSFDPRSMVCTAGDASDCLTEGQVTTLHRIYSGPTNPRTGEQIFPGYPIGTEAVPGGWAPWIVSREFSSAEHTSELRQLLLRARSLRAIELGFQDIGFRSGRRVWRCKSGAGAQCHEPRSAFVSREWRQTDSVSWLGRCSYYGFEFDRLLRKCAHLPRSLPRCPKRKYGYRRFLSPVPGSGHGTLLRRDRPK